MREIRFRGQAADTKEWVYGYLIRDLTCPYDYILNGVVEANEEYISIETWQPVLRESVGQFTGLKDKNGKEIWEGDIVAFQMKASHLRGIKTGLVQWVDHAASISILERDELERERNQGGIYRGFDATYDFVVIGNIYENPELLK